MILVDTNLLARMTTSAGVRGAASQRSVRRLRARGETLVIFPQCAYEFWSVATRNPGPPPSGQNGLGMSCRRAADWMKYFRRQFDLIPDPDDLVDRWQTLVQSYGIGGSKSYDVRLVAAMQAHSITRILTFNAGDFKKFAITVIDPASV
jgi:predicted nucleic acid-binding protein